MIVGIRQPLLPDVLRLIAVRRALDIGEIFFLLMALFLSLLQVGNFEASRFEGNDVAQKMVGEKLKDVTLNKEAAEHVNVIRNLPPYDVEATTPEKAYPLDKIIKKKEWNCLTDIMDLLQTNPDSILSTEFWQNSGYPVFVCNRIRKLGEVNVSMLGFFLSPTFSVCYSF